MTRNRKSAKSAGAKFEKAVADYLALKLNDDRIERRVTHGKNDTGDIAGVRLHGKRVVVECKNRRPRNEVGAVREANVERGNDDADFGIAVLKIDGVGMTPERMGEQLVCTDLETFAAMCAGGRDLLEGDDE